MRLFWKIFLAFWITTVVMVVISIALTALLGKQSLGHVNRQAIVDAAIFVAGKIENSGLSSIDNTTFAAMRRSGARITILDEKGKEVRGRAFKRTLTESMTELLAGIHTEHRRVTAPDGRVFVVRSIPTGNVARRLVSQYQWLRYFLMLCVSGYICFMVARYVLSPIREINRTSQLLSQGELDARVSPNVTRRVDEFGSLGRNYNSMANRLVTQIENQSQLLRDVSHELRSPLTRLQVALGLLHRQADPAQDKFVNRIETEAGRLDEMIGRILSMVRMDRGESGDTFKQCNLYSIVKKIADDANFEARSMNKTVVFEGDSDLNIEADEALIQSAVENVVRNALRYTDESKPVLVRVQAQIGNPDEVIVEVRDGGPGVPENSLDRLFDPFFRVSGARDRHSGGVGLGLSIARRAIDMHHGTIKAENCAQGGLCVRIKLPRSRQLAANLSRPSVGAPASVEGQSGEAA